MIALRSMIGPLRALLIPWAYLFLATLLSAVIAYPLYRFFGDGNLSFFRTLVSRIGQGLLLLGLIPIGRVIELRWTELGLSSEPVVGAVKGFLLGLSTLTLHAGLLMILTVRTPAFTLETLPPLASPIGVSLASGIGVALLEETIFRGALMAVILRLSGPYAALGVSALDYAALHFIGTKWTTDPALVGWDTGFRIALDGFSHLPQADPGSFLALFMAGLFLGIARLYFRGGLAFAIGLHAGWVFFIKLYKPLTTLHPESLGFRWVGTYDWVIGYLSAAWLFVLIGVIVFRHLLQKPSSSRP
jgi:uncharacterized protein